MVGRLRRRTREPGFPDRRSGRLDRRARHHRGLRAVDDLGLLGALQNNVYAEMATMFPNKSGGISLYAHEAWRKYLSADRPAGHLRLLVRLVGVLAINGFVIGTLVQAEWFSDTTFTQDVGNFHWSLPVYIGIGCHPRLDLQHLRRAAGGVAQLRHRRRADPAGCGADVPALPDRRLVERQHDWEIGTGGGLGWRSPGSTSWAGPRMGSRRRGVRARIPRPRVRHAAGAARFRRVLGGRLRAAAARRRRHARDRCDRRRCDR